MPIFANGSKITRGSISTWCATCRRPIMISLDDFPSFNEPSIFFCDQCDTTTKKSKCPSCELKAVPKKIRMQVLKAYNKMSMDNSFDF